MILVENKRTLLFILTAFTFSIVTQLIWIDQLKFNNKLMINSNDFSLFSSIPFHLSSFLAKILPFTFETILFYMPAFLSSLLVVPIILVGKKFINLEVGFLAALITSIVLSYFNYVIVGYYDTEILYIVFSAFLLWSLLWAIHSKKDIYLLLTAVNILAFRWVYFQGYVLEFVFFGLITFYLLYLVIKNYKVSLNLYEDKNIAYILQLLTIMILSMVEVEMTLRIMLVFGYFMLFRQIRWHKHLYIMFLMAMILFFTTGGFDPIWSQLQGYVLKI